MTKRSNDQEQDADWLGYMALKQKKLTNQFGSSSCRQKSTIFHGISVFVNGYTEPTSSEIRRLVMEHGGDYHAYKGKATTYVIASNLPTGKTDKLKLGEKVVRPAWVTDSIAAGQLLPHINYLLYGKQQNCGQLDKFATTTASTDTNVETAEPSTSAHVPAAASTHVFPKTTDKNFLQSFYSRSRLHHISMWAQEMKRLVSELRLENSAGSFPGWTDILQVATTNTTSPLCAIGEKVFVHLDMDCFFVSVGLRLRPELIGKPVAVTHSKAPGMSSDSRAEIPSCSYEARAAGVKNGMWMGEARKRCPLLSTVPYDFDAYHSVSTQLYKTVARYTLDIEAISCDELYLELGDVCRGAGVDPLTVISVIRSEIEQKTGCKASAGLGPNMLVARLATRKAKPNGQLLIEQNDVAEFMKSQPVSDLPGVGYQTVAKLQKLDVHTCGDLQAVKLDILAREFGAKTGRSLFDHCRGVDDRTLKASSAERKSVSCDVNYGIRFTTNSDALTFLGNLSEEMAKRLKEIATVGRTITLKLLIRAAGAPIEPSKFMGCGQCDAVSRSATLTTATADACVIDKQLATLYRHLRPSDVGDVRGVGVSVTRLAVGIDQRSAISNTASIKKFVKTRSDNHLVVADQKRGIFAKRRSQDDSTIGNREQCDIDDDILRELPTQLRDRMKPAADITEDDAEIELLANVEPVSVNQSPKSVMISAQPSFKSLTSYEPVKMAIKAMVLSSDGPIKSEVQELNSFLVESVHNNILMVWRLLRIMHGYISTNCKQGLWGSFYNDVYDSVQYTTTKLYGCPFYDLANFAEN